MIYDNRLIKEINDELSLRRKKAEAIAESYADVLNGNESYAALKKEHAAAKFDYSKARFAANENAAKVASGRITKAEAEMKKLQKTLGIADEMLIPRYFCKACGDTGNLPDGKKCKCFEKLAAEITLDELGIGKKDFPSFDEACKLTENGLDKIYAKFRDFCNHFPSTSKNVIISGSVGTGKSHLSECVAGELTKNGFNVVFLSATQLNTIFLTYHTAPVYDKSFYISLLSGCDLLVIDDLGTEPIYKNVTLEYLLTVLSERSAKNTPYIITTNLTQEQLLDRYGDRILSRLNDKKNGIRIEIGGKDLRRIK
mgnify:CR=1 FL=1